MDRLRVEQGRALQPGHDLLREERIEDGIASCAPPSTRPQGHRGPAGAPGGLLHECQVGPNSPSARDSGDALCRAAGSFSDAAATYQGGRGPHLPRARASRARVSPVIRVSPVGQGQSGRQPAVGQRPAVGGESDNPADKNKSRVEDKKQKAEERPKVRNGSTKRSKTRRGSGEAKPFQPDRGPYEGESAEQKQRRRLAATEREAVQRPARRAGRAAQRQIRTELPAGLRPLDSAL